MPLLRLLICALLCLGMGAVQAKRIALVIGNDNYQQVSRLEKAGNDAQAMSRELEAAGFEVSLKRDLGFRKMVVAFEEFYDKVKGGDEVVVFYAGHGVQTERGAYLLPTDIEGETQSQVEKISYSVNNLLEELDRVKARFSLVIVDACRDNPLRSRGRTIGIARGLNAPDIAKGQMVIFSAGRNQRALDSLNAADTSPNGVFTREFLARMRTPGRDIEALAIEVKNSVEKLAMTVKHEQRPLIVNDSTGDFSFFPLATAKGPNTAPAPATAVAEPSTREDRFWDDAKAADNLEAYEAYVAAYPDGRYRGLARAHMSRLNRPAGGAATVTAQNTRGASELVTGTAADAPPPMPRPSAVEATPPTALAPALAPEHATASRPAKPEAASGSTTVAMLPPAAANPTAPLPPTAAPAIAAPVERTPTEARYALANGDRYEGEVVGATRTGRGTYTFANGDRYQGGFVDNQFVGRGVMNFANGDRYEGVFQGTDKQGQGVLVFANGDRYEGNFVDNFYDGQGSLRFATGESYVGEFKRSLKQGKGVQVFANKDRYEGPFDNDTPHGKGAAVHANGDRFEGDYVHGVKQGAGVYRFANGDRYEGGFVEGVFSGRGRLYFSGGDRYEGEFRNNVREGQGTHYYANKDRFEGTFRNGSQQGTGTHHFANGDRYVGEYVDGVRHGKGTHHFVGGQTRQTEFVNGVEKER